MFARGKKMKLGWQGAEIMNISSFLTLCLPLQKVVLERESIPKKKSDLVHVYLDYSSICRKYTPKIGNLIMILELYDLDFFS